MLLTHGHKVMGPFSSGCLRTLVCSETSRMWINSIFPTSTDDAVPVEGYRAASVYPCGVC